MRTELGTGFMRTGTLFVFLGTVLLQFLAQLSIAMLALTITRIMMPRNSYHWLIALLIYFALAFAVSLVDSGLLILFGFIEDVGHSIQNPSVIFDALGKYFAVGAVSYTVWFIGCSILSGHLVHKNLDL